MVDNATASGCFGWAWDAAYPGLRVTVELRLAGAVVATTVADFPRADLAANGIGDGSHAFSFPLTDEQFQRRAELGVTAIGGDGESYPVMMRLRRPDDAQVATALQRAVEALATEQKGIRADHAALSARAATLADAETVTAVLRSNEALNRRMDELELWLARLDARAAPLPAEQTGHSGGLDTWQAVLIALLASAAAAALAMAAASYWS